jgi:hypothetical protein
MPKIIDMQYVRICSKNIERPLMILEHEVQRAINMGWQRKGNIIVMLDGLRNEYYLQSVVKYDLAIKT